MRCNGPLMNSWHTFSPNGRWLAFSSKSRGPYTRLMLTHIDGDGNDSPAIIVDNTTAANRAVNIPEFVNIPPDGLDQIDPEAMQFYRVSNGAFELMEKNQMPQAIAQWHKALEMDPNDALTHFGLAVALSGNNQETEAVEEYRRACDLDPTHAAWFDHLAVSLALTGDIESAVVNWGKSLALDPSNAKAEMQIGIVRARQGQTQQALDHLRKAVEMAPQFAEAHNALGWELAQNGQLDQAVAQLQKAVALMPTSAEYYLNLGYILELHGDSLASMSALEKSVDLSESKDWQSLAALAEAYNRAGRSSDAIQLASRAVALAVQSHDEPLQQKLRAALLRYQTDNQKLQSQ